MINPADVIDGRYVICDLLGRGGMADVFRATDTLTGGAVALKALRCEEPADALRFRAEADVLAGLDHPGLVRLHRSGTHDGQPYLVLDLAEGPSLTRELAGGPLGRDRALAVGEQVASALAHAHRAGVVHRDVKPSNILLDGPGRVVLADFGIARMPGVTGVTRTGQVVGSAPYLAPEQVVGDPAGPPADVYALGLVVIECLTGRRCYSGTQAEAAIVRLHRQPDIPAGLPPWLHDVLTAMTSRDPDRRPAADAVAEAFAFQTAEPVLAATAPLVAASGRPRAWPVRRRRRVSALAAASVAVLAGTLVAAGQPGDDGPASPAGSRRVGASAAAAPPTSVVSDASSEAGTASGSAPGTTAPPSSASPESSPSPHAPTSTVPSPPPDGSAPGAANGNAGGQADVDDRGPDSAASNAARGRGRG